MIPVWKHPSSSHLTTSSYCIAVPFRVPQPTNLFTAIRLTLELGISYNIVSCPHIMARSWIDSGEKLNGRTLCSSSITRRFHIPMSRKAILMILFYDLQHAWQQSGWCDIPQLGGEPASERRCFIYIGPRRAAILGAASSCPPKHWLPHLSFDPICF